MDHSDESTTINKRALLNGIPVFVRRMFRLNSTIKVTIETSSEVRNLDIGEVKSIIYANNENGNSQP